MRLQPLPFRWLPNSSRACSVPQKTANAFAVFFCLPGRDGAHRQANLPSIPFAGGELRGQTLGIVGLGKVGALVADAAISLGMP